MHQSEASPWGLPLGTHGNSGAFVEIVRYLLHEVLGEIITFVYTQRWHPRGHTLAFRWSAIYPIEDFRMLFEVFT